jgi:hypothetical protein
MISLPSRRLGIAGLLALLAGGCAENIRAHDYLGDKAAKVLAAADRVETFRVAPRHEVSDPTETLAGFPLIARGQPQGREFAASLGKVLLDDRSYPWDMAKACIFSPHIAYRVWSGQDSILVFICFDCDAVGIVPDEHDAAIRVHDDDPARPALLKLAKQAFPVEKSIQDLKE